MPPARNGRRVFWSKEVHSQVTQPPPAIDHNGQDRAELDDDGEHLPEGIFLERDIQNLLRQQQMSCAANGQKLGEALHNAEDNREPVIVHALAILRGKWIVLGSRARHHEWFFRRRSEPLPFARRSACCSARARNWASSRSNVRRASCSSRSFRCKSAVCRCITSSCRRVASRSRCSSAGSGNSLPLCQKRT